MPCFRAHPNPFKLMLKSFLPFTFLFLFNSQALLFLLKPGGIISFPRNSFTAVKLENPSCNIIKKIPVVSNCYYGSLIFLKMMFKPCNCFSIKMVGWFIEQKYIGL